MKKPSKRIIKAWAVIEPNGHVVADSYINSTIIDQIASNHAASEIVEVEISIAIHTSSRRKGKKKSKK